MIGKAFNKPAYTPLERIGRILAEQYDIQVVHAGDNCHTDSRTIVLPSVPTLPDDASEAEKELLKAFERSLEGKLDHEAAHILFTDWEAVERSYMHPLLKSWTNLFEDARIEREMVRMWPGSKKNLEDTQRFLLEEDLKDWSSLNAEQKAFKVAILITKGYEDWVDDVPHGHDLADEWSDVIPAFIRASEQATSMHSLALGVWVMDTLHPGWRTTDDAEKLAPSKGDMKKLMDTLSKMQGEGEGESEEEYPEEVETSGEILRTRLEKYDEEKHGEHDESPTARRKRKATRAKGSALNAAGSDSDQISSFAKQFRHTYGAKGAKYYAVYTTEGDEVVAVEDGDMAWFQEVRQKNRKASGTLIRKLRMVLTVRGYNRTEYEKTSGRLDTRRLTRFMMTGNPRCFKQVKKGEKLECRVCLLVDQSGSMSWGKIGHAREAAVLFGDFCNSLGIPFEILGFTTGDYRLAHERWDAAPQHIRERYTRWDDLVLYQYKEYGEKWDRVGHRLQNMQAMNHNLDGESVRVAAQRLLHAGHMRERKILFVFSDGMPAQAVSDYNENQKEYLRTVMDQLERSHVEAVGIGITTDAPKHYYPNWVSISDPSDLAGAQVEKLRELLVGQRRRTRKMRG